MQEDIRESSEKPKGGQVRMFSTFKGSFQASFSTQTRELLQALFPTFYFMPCLSLSLTKLFRFLSVSVIVLCWKLTETNFVSLNQKKIYQMNSEDSKNNESQSQSLEKDRGKERSRGLGIGNHSGHHTAGRAQLHAALVVVSLLPGPTCQVKALGDKD